MSGQASAARVTGLQPIPALEGRRGPIDGSVVPSLRAAWTNERRLRERHRQTAAADLG